MCFGRLFLGHDLAHDPGKLDAVASAEEIKKPAQATAEAGLFFGAISHLSAITRRTTPAPLMTTPVAITGKSPR